MCVFVITDIKEVAFIDYRSASYNNTVEVVFVNRQQHPWCLSMQFVS